MSNFESDSVSSLHKRWLFTNINPSSEKFSFLIAILSLITNIALINFVITPHSIADFLISLPIIASVFSVTLVFDYLSLRGTPLNRFSKVLHVAAFANLLWTLTVIGGYISEFIINTNTPNINFVLQGMFMAIGLRIGIFVSVFGASLKRSIPISFIQPLIIFILFSFFYFNHIFYTNFTVYVFGSVILFIGVLWTIVIDRIGRPNFTSAFKILQAFLIAWTENKSDEMEKIAEAKASPKMVNTLIVKLRPKNQKEISIVLPELHPGPFNPIGGSNLPYDIFKFYSNSAMVMHSVSDHSLNIPSKKEVEKYLTSLDQYNHLTPDQRRQERLRYQAFNQQFPPDKQNQARRLFRQFGELPPERQGPLRKEFENLRVMPEAERRSRINSDEFRSRYDSHEQKILSDLSGLISK